MDKRIDPLHELLVCLAFAILAGAVLVEASSIRPGFFEPLGSGPVPRATAWGIIALAALAAASAAMRLIRGERGAQDGDERWLDALAVFGLTGLYLAALTWRVTTFSVMTTIYLVLTIGLLVGFRRARLPWVAAVAAVVGFGGQYVFTRVFVIDLPGL